MSGTVRVHTEADAIVVSIPLKRRKRSTQGRKLMVAPGDKPVRRIANREHGTILKALGRAYRWKRMLESGEFASITDLAKNEKINHAYVRRILRLTLLSPAMTESILEGDSPVHLQAITLIDVSTGSWADQEICLRTRF